jgi:DNA-binding beta-propeller fold protein YncE
MTTSRSKARVALILTSGAAIGVLSVGATAVAATPVSVGVGLPPTAVAIDSPDHTAYVAVSDGTSDQVAVIDTSACTSTSTGCATDVAAVNLEEQAGPSALAYDPTNHTVYVADANTGDVSMIDATTCNAAVTTGCADAPGIATFTGLTSPSAVAVDASDTNDAIYVADSSSDTVTVFGGVACDATVTTGCAVFQTASVGSAPSAVAVDSADGTVYVANLGDDTVSTLNELSCSTVLAACSTATQQTVALGTGAAPAALAVTSGTLYVADSGLDAVSRLNTATCNTTVTTSCESTPSASEAGPRPVGLTTTGAGNVAVADSGADAVVVFAGATCNATTATGCATATVDTLTGAPVAIGAAGSTLYVADQTNSSVDLVASSAPPTITAKVTSAHPKTKYGWYRSPITVTYTCHTGTAPLTGTCPAKTVFAKNGKNLSVTKTIKASDGETGTVTVSKLMLDQTKPTVKVTGVKSGKTYSKTPKLKCVAHDSLSGLAKPCKITRTHHGHVTKYVATATDKAGNVATAHGKYTVK